MKTSLKRLLQILQNGNGLRPRQLRADLPTHILQKILYRFQQLGVLVLQARGIRAGINPLPGRCWLPARRPAAAGSADRSPARFYKGNPSGPAFRRRPGSSAAAFSNPGFFGIPIILSCLDSGAVFYIAAYVAFLNLLQWSYGVGLLTGRTERFPLKKLLSAPFVIAIAIGLLFFLTGLPVPGLIRQTVTHLANLNTHLAMFVTGVYLAQTKPAEMLHKPVFYRISLVKLLVIPLLTILILIPLPARYADLKRTLLIASACPTGTNIAVYAQLYDRDFGYAVETVTVTTLLSLVTLPLMVQLAERIW